MIRSAFISLALLLSTAPAAAADMRLSSRLYNANEVVRIDGRAGVQATIAFGEDEHIENVAIGDSNSWQVTPNKRANLLFVKPLAPRAQTNLTVVTDRHSYFFDLVASPLAKPMYLLRFDYPPELKPQEPQLRGQRLSTVEAAAARGERPIDTATLNYAWRSKGKSKLLPARVYDDGHSTYLSWPKGKSLPVILIRNEKGEEGPVNFAVRNDVIAIDGVPSVIVLRAGKDSATLEYARRSHSRAKAAQMIAYAPAGELIDAPQPQD